MTRFEHDLVAGDDGREYAKIEFPVLNDLHVNSETMWGQHIEGERFRLMNIPGWVGGVSRGDAVDTQRKGTHRTFKGVVERAGHSTYRVAFQDPDATPDSHPRWTQLLSLGCSIEALSTRMFAVDVPSETPIETVYAALRDGMVDGEWWFDEMHCGHLVGAPDGDSGPRGS